MSHYQQHHGGGAAAPTQVEKIKKIMKHMQNLDKDYRYMAVNDFTILIQKEQLQLSAEYERKLVEIVLTLLLKDKNSSVQNLTINALKPFINSISDAQKQVVVQILCESLKSSNPAIRDISIIGIKHAIIALPDPNPNTSNSKTSTLACHTTILTLAQDLMEILGSTNISHHSIRFEILNLCTELFSRFGDLLVDEHEGYNTLLSKYIDNPNNLHQKAAINTLATLSVQFTPQLFMMAMNCMLKKITTSSKFIADFTHQKNGPNKDKGQNEFLLQCIIYTTNIRLYTALLDINGQNMLTKEAASSGQDICTCVISLLADLIKLESKTLTKAVGDSDSMSNSNSSGRDSELDDEHDVVLQERLDGIYEHSLLALATHISVCRNRCSIDTLKVLMSLACKMVTYDPYYDYDCNDMEVDRQSDSDSSDNSSDNEDDGFDSDDDEDLTFKIRREAAKVIEVILGSIPQSIINTAVRPSNKPIISPGPTPNHPITSSDPKGLTNGMLSLCLRTMVDRLKERNLVVKMCIIRVLTKCLATYRALYMNGLPKISPTSTNMAAIDSIGNLPQSADYVLLYCYMIGTGAYREEMNQSSSLDTKAVDILHNINQLQDELISKVVSLIQSAAVKGVHENNVYLECLHMLRVIVLVLIDRPSINKLLLLSTTEKETTGRSNSNPNSDLQNVAAICGLSQENIVKVIDLIGILMESVPGPLTANEKPKHKYSRDVIVQSQDLFSSLLANHMPDILSQCSMRLVPYFNGCISQTYHTITHQSLCNLHRILTLNNDQQGGGRMDLSQNLDATLVATIVHAFYSANSSASVKAKALECLSVILSDYNHLYRESAQSIQDQCGQMIEAEYNHITTTAAKSKKQSKNLPNLPSMECSPSDLVQRILMLTESNTDMGLVPIQSILCLVEKGCIPDLPRTEQGKNLVVETLARVLETALSSQKAMVALKCLSKFVMKPANTVGNDKNVTIILQALFACVSGDRLEIFSSKEAMCDVVCILNSFLYTSDNSADKQLIHATYLGKESSQGVISMFSIVMRLLEGQQHSYSNNGDISGDDVMGLIDDWLQLDVFNSCTLPGKCNQDGVAVEFSLLCHIIGFLCYGVMTLNIPLVEMVSSLEKQYNHGLPLARIICFIHFIHAKANQMPLETPLATFETSLQSGDLNAATCALESIALLYSAGVGDSMLFKDITALLLKYKLAVEEMNTEHMCGCIARMVYHCMGAGAGAGARVGLLREMLDEVKSSVKGLSSNSNNDNSKNSEQLCIEVMVLRKVVDQVVGDGYASQSEHAVDIEMTSCLADIADTFVSLIGCFESNSIPITTMICKCSPSIYTSTIVDKLDAIVCSYNNSDEDSMQQSITDHDLSVIRTASQVAGMLSSVKQTNHKSGKNTIEPYMEISGRILSQLAGVMQMNILDQSENVAERLKANTSIIKLFGKLNFDWYTSDHVIYATLPRVVHLLVRYMTPQHKYIRKVQVGRDSMVVDDGLDMRTSAYESIANVVRWGHRYIDAEYVIGTVIQEGFADHNDDIQLMAHSVAMRLIKTNPTEVSKHLLKMTQILETHLSKQINAKAALHEQSRHENIKSSLLRVLHSLYSDMPSCKLDKAFMQLYNQCS